MQNFFYRKQDSFINNTYTKKVSQLLNLSTIDTWTLKKTVNLFNEEFKDWYLWYRFYVLHSWFNQNKNLKSYDLINNVIKKIQILNLGEFLNIEEKNLLFNEKFKQFTKIRNLKSLLIDFSLEKDECVYYSYKNISFKLNYKIRQENIIFFISNKRIILSLKNELISLYLNKIESFSFEKNVIKILYYGHTYFFKTDLTNIIKISLERITKTTNHE